jgi:hypothetical protein
MTMVKQKIQNLQKQYLGVLYNGYEALARHCPGGGKHRNWCFSGFAPFKIKRREKKAFSIDPGAIGLSCGIPGPSSLIPLLLSHFSLYSRGNAFGPPANASIFLGI